MVSPPLCRGENLFWIEITKLMIWNVTRRCQCVRSPRDYARWDRPTGVLFIHDNYARAHKSSGAWMKGMHSDQESDPSAASIEGAFLLFPQFRQEQGANTVELR
jgi:hypothetical protein